MLNKIIYGLLFIAIILGITSIFLPEESQAPEPVACTDDAKVCPDGSVVGRTGLDCEFNCPTVEVPEDVQTYIESKADLITVSAPEPMTVVTSPLSLSGEARGYWFFEGDAPVVLTDWDGRIIAESFITAGGDWMTEDKVPFSGELTFTSPYSEGDPDFMRRGTLIFQKDNPSGLPENDDALEIPIRFMAN